MTTSVLNSPAQVPCHCSAVTCRRKCSPQKLDLGQACNLWGFVVFQTLSVQEFRDRWLFTALPCLLCTFALTLWSITQGERHPLAGGRAGGPVLPGGASRARGGRPVQDAAVQHIVHHAAVVGTCRCRTLPAHLHPAGGPPGGGQDHPAA
jgi:hypothetical protein